MASRSFHKKIKFGQLPGDIPIGAKIQMLESRDEFYLFPWQLIDKNAISSFRRDHKKRSNRRFRRQKPDF